MPLAILRNASFLRLYLAQVVSLLGDAFTWVGLAILAFRLAGDRAPVVLGTALTVRVLAFVLFSPIAGALADRLDRKLILVTCDIGRLLVVALIPLVTSEWPLYALAFALNVFTAFFTPTNQASVLLVTSPKEAGPAFGLSSATAELIGVAGPAVAGILAALVGWRSLFLFDAGSYLISALLIFMVPISLRVTRGRGARETTALQDALQGTRRLWRDQQTRFALLMELVAAIAGALVLVNTITHVKAVLGLGDAAYGTLMAVYGAGAALASLAFVWLGRRMARVTFTLIGALVTTLAVLPADLSGYAALLALWLVAGFGQNWTGLPTVTLLAERAPEGAQGGIFGAHFAWSHLWWAFAYPLAGWLGVVAPNRAFLYGALIAGAVFTLVVLVVPAGGRRAEPRADLAP